MSKQKKIFLFYLLSFFSLTVSGSCQTFGKLYTIDEVNQLHGPVLQKVAFSPTQFQTFLTETNKVLMFTFKSDNLFIAVDGRKVIYPDSTGISPDDTLEIFSKSNIEDLLNGAFSDSVYIEKRSEVISITYDNTTLELPGYCPPFCF